MASQTPNHKTIAFCIEALTVGGAEQMLVAMANQFVLRGWHVHMICLTKAGELADNLSDEVNLHVLDKKPGADLHLPKRLRALVKRIKPIAINSHLWTANLWTRVSLLGAGTPIFVTEHSRDTWKPRHYRLLDKLLIKSTRKLIAVSNDTADFYKDDIGLSEKKIQVINNGVDTQRYASGNGDALRKMWAPDGQLLIGTVGRMVPAKNHLRFLKVAAAVSQQISNVKFVLVGDGELRAEVEAEHKALELQNIVELAGSRTDIPDVLAALDIFVLSSDREGHPLTALEAAAASTPVVLTKAGGSADAIAVDGDNIGGLLVEKDEAELTKALLTLVSDKQRLKAMGEFAQTHALANFDMQHMVDAYEQLFTAGPSA